MLFLAFADLSYKIGSEKDTFFLILPTFTIHQ